MKKKVEILNTLLEMRNKCLTSIKRLSIDLIEISNK